MASYDFTMKHTTLSMAQNPATQSTSTALQCSQKLLKDLALEFFIPS